MRKSKKYYEQLNIMAKAFYNLSVREGPIEDFHAEGHSIGNAEMEKINRFGVNRLGFLLDLLLSGETEDLYKICRVGALGVSYFDPIDLNSEENKQMKKLKKMLKEEF